MSSDKETERSVGPKQLNPGGCRGLKLKRKRTDAQPKPKTKYELNYYDDPEKRKEVLLRCRERCFMGD